MLLDERIGGPQGAAVYKASPVRTIRKKSPRSRGQEKGFDTQAGAAKSGMRVSGGSIGVRIWGYCPV